MVEQIEDLRDAFHGRAVVHGELLLHARIDTVQRQTDEIIPRHDRPVRAKTERADASEVSQVGAVVRREARAGPVEVQPAYLETVFHLPDAIQHDAVPLIVLGE